MSLQTFAFLLRWLNSPSEKKLQIGTLEFLARAHVSDLGEDDDQVRKDRRRGLRRCCAHAH